MNDREKLKIIELKYDFLITILALTITTLTLGIAYYLFEFKGAINFIIGFNAVYMTIALLSYKKGKQKEKELYK